MGAMIRPFPFAAPMAALLFLGGFAVPVAADEGLEDLGIRVERRLGASHTLGKGPAVSGERHEFARDVCGTILEGLQHPFQGTDAGGLVSVEASQSNEGRTWMGAPGAPKHPGHPHQAPLQEIPASGQKGLLLP